MASLAEVPKTQAWRMLVSSWADSREKSGHLLTSTMTGLRWVCCCPGSGAGLAGLGAAGGLSSDGVVGAPGGPRGGGEAPSGSQTGAATTGASTGTSADGLRMAGPLQLPPLLLLLLLTLDTDMVTQHSAHPPT